MKKITLKIESDELEQLAAVGISYFDSWDNKYVRKTDTMIVAASETYKFLNGSTQLNMLVLFKEEGIITIDIIGAAGGSGMWNWNWGTESRYAKRMRELYESYCRKRNLSIR